MRLVFILLLLLGVVASVRWQDLVEESEVEFRTRDKRSSPPSYNSDFDFKLGGGGFSRTGHSPFSMGDFDFEDDDDGSEDDDDGGGGEDSSSGLEMRGRAPPLSFHLYPSAARPSPEEEEEPGKERSARTPFPPPPPPPPQPKPFVAATIPLVAKAMLPKGTKDKEREERKDEMNQLLKQMVRATLHHFRTSIEKPPRKPARKTPWRDRKDEEQRRKFSAWSKAMEMVGEDEEEDESVPSTTPPTTTTTTTTTTPPPAEEEEEESGESDAAEGGNTNKRANQATETARRARPTLTFRTVESRNTPLYTPRPPPTKIGGQTMEQWEEQLTLIVVYFFIMFFVVITFLVTVFCTYKLVGLLFRMVRDCNRCLQCHRISNQVMLRANEVRRALSRRRGGTAAFVGDGASMSTSTDSVRLEAVDQNNNATAMNNRNNGSGGSGDGGAGSTAAVEEGSGGGLGSGDGSDSSGAEKAKKKEA